MSQAFSRRYFFYGTLLAGAIPRGGFGSTPSLKAAGYKSPNEKLNLAAIGAGGQPAADLRAAQAGVENVVALADVDWVRGKESFERFPKATKYKDFRQMLDKQEGHRRGDRGAARPHARHLRAGLHANGQARLRGETADPHAVGGAPVDPGRRRSTTWRRKWATRDTPTTPRAWHARFSGRARSATSQKCTPGPAAPAGRRGCTKIAAPTPVPDTLDWDLWLGGAASRPFTAGDDDYKAFVDKRNNGRASDGFGFYLPFNWRGFYDFGSSLIGDWGVHILGPANWGLQLGPEHLISVECIKKDSLPPFTFPDELALKFEFAARPGMPPVTVYWYHHAGGDAYIPPGMTAEQARKIPAGRRWARTRCGARGPVVAPEAGGRARLRRGAPRPP